MFAHDNPNCSFNETLIALVLKLLGLCNIFYQDQAAAAKAAGIQVTLGKG
jgi:hypothetical protein